jgi:hypothetical protein
VPLRGLIAKFPTSRRILVHDAGARCEWGVVTLPLSAWKQAVKQAPGELAALADNESRRRMLALRFQQLREGNLDSSVAGDAVPLRVKALNGHRLHVRPRSGDIDMIWCTYVTNGHLPPGVDSPEPRIVELGTKIGAALAGLAARYPRAKLLGVEPDPQNAALARRNVEVFGHRCRVVEAAIWDRDTELVTRSVGSVLDSFEPCREVDYLSMRIEGTELRVLEADDVGWADRVRSIRVESEREYGSDPSRCADALRRLGFEPRIEPRSGGALVFGVRR